MERWQDGLRSTGSRSKCKGSRTTGICAILSNKFASCKIYKKQINTQFTKVIRKWTYRINFRVCLSHLGKHMLAQVSVGYIGDRELNGAPEYVANSVYVV